MKHKIVLFLMLGSSILVGCGGVSPSKFQGSVIDGYIQNAIVCLDINSNLVCDPEEPQAVTDATGSYSFEYSGDTKGLHIIALVNGDSVDLDLGPVTEPFTLLAPASAPKAITPLTTLVSSEMIEQGTSAEDAQIAIRASFGLDRDLLDYDFKKASDVNTGQVAQLAAIVFANAMSAISSDANAAAKMSAAKVLKAAIDEAKNTVLPALLSRDGRPLVNISQVRSHQELSDAVKQVVDVKAVIGGKINVIVARSESSDGGVLDWRERLSEGVVAVELKSATLLEEDGSKGPDTKTSIALALFKSVRGEVRAVERLILYEDDNHPIGWYPRTEWEDTPYFFNGTEWEYGVSEKSFVGFDGNCLFLTRQPAGRVGFRYCGRDLKLAGRRLAEFSPAFCETQFVRTKSCDPDAVFPANAIGIDLTVSANEDYYTLYLDDDGYGGNLDTLLTSARVFNGNGVCMKIDPSRLIYVANQITGGRISFAIDGGNCRAAQEADFVEAATFSLEEVGGKRVLRFPTPNLVRKVRPGDVQPFIIFAEAVTQAGVSSVFKGQLFPKGYRISIPFTTAISRSPQVASVSVLNAYMKEIGVPLYRHK